MDFMKIMELNFKTRRLNVVKEQLNKGKDMFLIEFETGRFINGEDIQWVQIKPEKIEFTVRGDIESCFQVANHLQSDFANHLQALNNNISSVESTYRKINELNA